MSILNKFLGVIPVASIKPELCVVKVTGTGDFIYNGYNTSKLYTQ